jgi:hypothetical protein
MPWHRWFVYTYEKALREECGYTGYQPVRHQSQPASTCVIANHRSIGTGPNMPQHHKTRQSSMAIHTVLAETVTMSHTTDRSLFHRLVSREATSNLLPVSEVDMSLPVLLLI